ncbi:MAG: CBS domain-containing protein [Planctomycetota bacterium]
MKIRDILKEKPQTIEAHESVTQAAKIMTDRSIGSLPVVEKGKTVGFLTDRDIVTRVCSAGTSPTDCRVQDVMTPRLLSCNSEDDLETAASLMKEHKVRRLAVHDESKQLLGVISLGDITQFEQRSGSEAMQTICTPG